MKKINHLTALLLAVSFVATCACSKTDSTEKTTTHRETETIESTSEAVESDTTSSVGEKQSEETTTDSTTESTTEATVEIEEKVLLSGGPMIMETTDKGKGFNLYQFSLETGESKKVFSFKNSFDSETPGSINYLYTDTLYCFNRQIFDSSIERMAIYWQVNPDEWHVGWIDKDENITDVTSKLRGESSGFDLLPKDKYPLFDSQDRFVFYNDNEKAFCYYDVNSNTIIETLVIDQNSDYGRDITYSLMLPSHTWSLDFNDRPIGSMMELETKEGILYDDMFGGLDAYVDCADGTVFLGILSDGAIYQGGAGVYEVQTQDDGVKYYYDSRFPYEGTEYRRITPESDWKVYSLAYGDNKILFTAERQNTYALFKMSYENKTAGEPEQVTGISHNQRLFFWDGREIEVRVID